MDDVKRVARAYTGDFWKILGDLWEILDDDDKFEIALRIKAAMRETRLIDAEALRDEAKRFRNKVGVNYAADWLQFRAGDTQ